MALITNQVALRLAPQISMLAVMTAYVARSRTLEGELKKRLMYSYQEPSLFSGKRGLVFLLVIIFHIGLGYALVNGLARKIVQVIIPPVEIAQIDKPKDIDKPPPPPPKLEEVKPFVPPPEFVDIQAPVETAAITQTTSVQHAPTPTAVAPRAVARTSVHQDPKHPLHIGEDYYPDASKRNNEEGTCRVQVHVAVDGRIVDATVQQSSGFPRLDEACLKGVKGLRMMPATEDGKPIDSVAVLPITWKLRSDH
jgi:periplasmic protein TonB